MINIISINYVKLIEYCTATVNLYKNNKVRKEKCKILKRLKIRNFFLAKSKVMLKLITCSLKNLVFFAFFLFKINISNINEETCMLLSKI